MFRCFFDAEYNCRGEHRSSAEKLCFSDNTWENIQNFRLSATDFACGEIRGRPMVAPTV